MHPNLRTMAEYCVATKQDLVRACDWHTHDDSHGYLAMKRTPGARILAVAHMDFLCSGKVHYVSRKRIISSALDDRAGVYIVMDLLPKLGILADVLLTDNEETGSSTIRNLGVGMLDRYNWIVQFDRRNEGAVHYGYTEMLPLLGNFFPSVERGTFTCISAIESCSPCGAFNVGVGYSREHSEQCSLDARALNRQMMRFLDFYNAFGDTLIPHIGASPGKETHECRYTTNTRWNDYRTPTTIPGQRKGGAISTTTPTTRDRELLLFNSGYDDFSDDATERCCQCGAPVRMTRQGYQASWVDDSLCDDCYDYIQLCLDDNPTLHCIMSGFAWMDDGNEGLWFWSKTDNKYHMLDTTEGMFTEVVGTSNKRVRKGLGDAL